MNTIHDSGKSTLEELLQVYREAALEHRSASRSGDSRKANRAYLRLIAVIRELRRRGPDAHKALLRLLEDRRTEVRGWAAAHALEIAPKQAVKVLEEIASGPSSLEELSAQMVLREWRSGRLEFFG